MVRDLAAQAVGRTISFDTTPSHILERLAAAKKLFGEIDVFVAPVPTIAREFEALGVERARIRVSDYGFPAIAWTGVRRASTPLRIGFIGTLVWHKGLHVLIEAVRRLPPDAYRLQIFGDPTNFVSYVDDLRRQASGAPVQFMGAFDRDEVARVYGDLDVLVVPSLWLENSPLVIHDAFSAGVPVVGARIGGIPDLVADGRNGLLYEPTSAKALAAALQRLIDDAGLVSLLAQGARATPVKTIEQDAKEWESVYADVSRQRASRAVS
jgi:glycosyltransferase involved in cell wall biosynthesis